MNEMNLKNIIEDQIETFKSQSNKIPYGICTDYPSLLVNFYG